MNPINEKNAGEVARAVKDSPVQSAGTVRRSLSIATLAAAMAKVQAEIDDPAKNKRADAGRRGSYRYVDLPAVLDVVRPILTANGLSVVQFPCELEDAPALTTLLMHNSAGEWMESTIKLRPGALDPQSVGSALTYYRRYALLALCGIAADDDDDGRKASDHKTSDHKTAQQQAPKPAQPAAPSQWAIDFARKVQAVPTRDAGIELWKEYEGKVKAGHVPAQDKALIDGEFKAMGARFPKEPAPQPSGTK